MRTSLGPISVALAALFGASEGAAQPARTTTSTQARTATAALSKEDLELSRYLHVVEDLEFLMDVQLVEVLPLLEASYAR